MQASASGALSNPHDRYGSRLAPLAPLALAVAVLSRRGISRTPARRWILVEGPEPVSGLAYQTAAAGPAAPVRPRRA
jgi:hypothetical protein